MGFGSQIVSKNTEELSELMKNVSTEDLLKYGLIPEFIGRIPSVVTLEELDAEALVMIMSDTKNCLVDQYKELFNMDDVELEIEKGALEAIAEEALRMKTGARGLRGIMEKIMTGIMFEIPSRQDIEKCVITRETVTNSMPPTLLLNSKSKLESSTESA